MTEHHGHDDGASGHVHAVAADADRRYLGGALALIVAFMITEVTVGVIAGSLALISDAGAAGPIPPKTDQFRET